jgi:hypothetical protein
MGTSVALRVKSPEIDRRPVRTGDRGYIMAIAQA